MVSSVLPLILAATLGQQAPAEAAWLKAVPADADAVVYVKGVGAVRDDLLAMIRAMSPTLAKQAEPALNQALDNLTQQATPEVTKTPVLAVLGLPKGDAEGPPPMAILGKIEDVGALVKSITGSDQTEKQPGGFEKATGKGEDLYLYRGDGFVAIGPNADLIRAMAAKPSATLDAKIPAELKAKLFGGDVGGYISLVALQTKYGDQIEQARQALMAAMDQIGGQMQASQVEQAKKMYGALFDALKEGDALALNLDFDAAQLRLSGLVTVKPGTDAAKALAKAQVGSAAPLAAMPADYLMYVYMNVDPENFEQLMQFNMANAFGNQGDNAATRKALDAMKASGRQEVAGAMSFGNGINVINVSNPEDPRALIDSTKQMMTSMKDNAMMKDVKIEENAETYKDIKFTKISATFDLDKMVAAQPNNPQAKQVLEGMFGKDATMTSWYGTDGKQVISITGKSFDQVKPKLDALLGGSGGIGQSAGFKAVRSKLPEQVGMVLLVNAQQLVTQMSSLMSSVTGADMPAPTGMPKDAVFFGGSIGSSKAGTQFDFVVPSTVGPVFEKGFGPMIQGMQGQINQ
jgi:hypothetical protein